MISKINRIRNLGLVFGDFTWRADIPSFRQVNLIYGWNGCGKTTLTRLFDLVASPGESDVEYEIESADGAITRKGDTFEKPIRVFNQAYVEANVSVIASTAKTISILLGEENKDLLAEIEADELLLIGVAGNTDAPGLRAEFRGLTQKQKRKEKENDTAFTEIAKAISAATTGSGTAARTYRAPDARKDFARLSAPASLEPIALEEAILSIRQDLLPEVPLVSWPWFAQARSDAIQEVLQCHQAANLLFPLTVEAEVVRRLADNPDISAWVEEGVRVHGAHGSTECEYCGNAISVDRMAALSRHFSAADAEMKEKLEAITISLRNAWAEINQIATPDPARLYQELRSGFADAIEAWAEAKATLLAEVAALGKAVQLKKTKTTETMPPIEGPSSASLIAALAGVNAIIAKHNEKSLGFQRIRSEAVEAARNHYLSSIYQEVKEREAAIAELTADLTRRGAEIEEIQARIAAKRAQISSDHRACEDINKALKTFLGRDELRFEPEVEAEGSGGAVVGYKIMRGSEPAAYLSEGERTALAFVYFVVHLNDGQFQKANGIVVIDDPISSLDSNSLYQAFSFLKNAILGCGQAFILTHNFDFLKLLLNWRAKVQNRTGYYMINNWIDAGVRRASVQRMDKELCEYESEYHYLFKRLKQARAEQDGSIMRAYPVPNLARKLWETFLMFRVPNGLTPYKKHEILKASYDPVKLDAIYKFTNDQSHVTGAGFDPSLVPETRNALDHIFGMMEEMAKEHYDILDHATQ